MIMVQRRHPQAYNPRRIQVRQATPVKYGFTPLLIVTKILTITIVIKLTFNLYLQVIITDLATMVIIQVATDL